jgi:hypothetical protein
LSFLKSIFIFAASYAGKKIVEFSEDFLTIQCKAENLLMKSFFSLGTFEGRICWADGNLWLQISVTMQRKKLNPPKLIQQSLTNLVKLLLLLSL